MGVLCLAMLIVLSEILSPSSVALDRVGNTLVPIDRFENRLREEQYMPIPNVSGLSDIKGLASKLNTPWFVRSA